MLGRPRTGSRPTKYRRQRLCKKLSSVHHSTTLSCCIFATKACIDNRKKFLNSNVSSTCPHNMVNFSPLTAEISWPVWGAPANFNRFRVSASLLHQCCSTEVNQTLHNVCLSLGLVHYIFSAPEQNCHVQNSLCVQSLVFSYIGSVNALHSSSGHQSNFLA